MLRRALLVIVVASAALLVGGPARADGSVDEQAWSRTGLIPTFLAEPGHLYVSAELGTESARSYVHVDTSSLGTGGDTGVVLHLTEVTAAATLLADTAAIVACPLTTPIVGSGEISAETAPSVDCSAGVPASREADGIWSVPLDTFLRAWRAGPELGLALVAVPTDTATFRVTFDAAGTTVSASPVPGGAASQPAAPPASGQPGAIDVPAGALEIGGAMPPLPGLAAPAAPATSSSDPTGQAPVASDPATSPLAVGPVRVASPPAAVVLSLVGVGAVALSVPFARRRPRLRPSHASVPTGVVGGGAGALALVFLPLLLAEATVYKLGLVLIVLVAAIGLHLLVTWAGELSLAHAALVGLPAFVVARLSADHGISPILLLPIGVAVGLLAGAVVGIPAIRARGLQVALVTLAAGVAIDRFFFTKEWLVGSVSDDAVATPSLGPLTFTTSRSMHPVLAIVVVLTVLCAWAIYRSKLGRGFLWIKAQPEAAAAFGIPVARYRAMAFALAGGFAGLAGGLTTMWVQRLTPEAFPLSRSFTLLIIVALAGRGFVGGVALAAALIEGGQLFFASGDAFITYAAPIGLILTLTQHPAGLNGFGRQLAARVRSMRTEGNPTMRDNKVGVRPLLAAGTASVAIGFASIVLAWYHAGNTSQVWIQNQEMILGGVGGLGLVIVGVALVVYDRLLAARAVESERWERVIAAVETSLAERESDRPRRRRLSVS